MKAKQLFTLALAVIIAFALVLSMGQFAAAEVSKEELQSISTPDSVETSIGTLKFFDGVPTDDTVQTVYDNLDRMRGVQVFLNTLGGASMYRLRAGNKKLGVDKSNKLSIFAKLMDSKPLYLTANTSTLYQHAFLDTEIDGPTVLEVPPGMLGVINDSWFRYVADIGVIGPDKGKGGKYLVLPPGYKGEVPSGYFVVRPKTFWSWFMVRGSTAQGLEHEVKLMEGKTKIYPLAKAGNPPKTEYIDTSGMSYNTVSPNDFSFYEDLNHLIQKEPIDALDPETRGLVASIGIVKGKPFKPDARMKKLLTEAVAIGNATARAIVFQPREKAAYIYPDSDSAWVMAYFGKDVFFEVDGARNLDARTNFFYAYTVVTPAMAVTMAGKGSDYAIAYLDSKKKPLDGAKTYKLHLPPKVPVNNFWAVTMYDTQTRSQLQTRNPYPSLGSLNKGIKKNADGSYDIYFGPKPPPGKESNWLETIPGKSWFTILRMYGPLEPWIKKTWRPGEIELVASALAAEDSGPRKHAEGRYDASTNSYSVVAGDDLSEIAERFGTTVGELETLNKLASDKITVGQRLVVAAAGTAAASDSPQSPKYATEMPPGIAAPAEVKTRLGTLRTKDGFPDQATLEKVFDNLGFQLGVQSVLTAMPGASLAAMRRGMREFGPDNQTVLQFPTHMDSKSLFLTANTAAIYNFIWLNTKQGPLVIDVPPQGLGAIDNFWFHWVGDVGETGPDKGKGGKYLLLPPGYKGKVPEGYHVLHSPTYNHWFFLRVFGKPEAAVASVKKNLRIYPLAKAANPPKMNFVNLSGKNFNTIGAIDFSYFEDVNTVVQEEPNAAMDSETLGLLASIGIEKGKPFKPDARMKKILTEAAAVGNITARALAYKCRIPESYFYKNSAWGTPFIGGSYEFLKEKGVRDLDARTYFFFYATGITPSMAMEMVGKGSAYAAAFVDAKGDPLDGGKTYKIHLPPNIPAKQFWSFVLYSSQTRSMLQTDQQFPSTGSLKKGIVVNSDKSVDVYFGQKAPAGMENNWVQTVPGKGWNVLFRLYGPLEPWFKKTWRPSEIELVK